MVLYNTGARAQEVADLRVEDVDLTGQCAYVFTGRAISGEVVRSGLKLLNC